MSRVETIGGATLYLGDCREILPTLGKIDAVVTDPPYGIGWDYGDIVDSHENWISTIDWLVPWCRANARKFAMAAGSSIKREAHLFKHDPIWRVCWHKGSQGARCPIGFSDWEPIFIWGDGFGNAEKMHDYFSTAGLWPKKGEINHPCPKPVAWAAWLVSRMSRTGHVIVDPFMGSGTTGIACAELGRNFVGIEINPEYFDVACARIHNAKVPLPLEISN